MPNENICFDSNENAFETLRKSPIFALTMGGKEISHTNFLACILNNRDESLFELRKGILTFLGYPNLQKKTEINVFRELLNFDLVIALETVNNIGIKDTSKEDKEELKNAEVKIVVEAKLKSLPNQEQLNDYDIKLGIINTKRASYGGQDYLLTFPKENLQKKLLTIFSPNFETKNWEAKTWESLLAIIENFLNSNENKNENKNDTWTVVLRDYLKTTRLLLEFSRKEIEKIDNNWDKIIWGKLQEELYTYDQVRLHDLISKQVMAKLLQEFAECLVLKVKWDKTDVLYTNKTCGFEFQKTVTFIQDGQPIEKLLIISIQGNDCRRCIVSKNDKDLVEGQLWKEWFAADGFHGLTQNRPAKGGIRFDQCNPNINSLNSYKNQDGSIFYYSKASIADKNLQEIKKMVSDGLEKIANFCKGACS